jgi:hypothetical protein
MKSSKSILVGSPAGQNEPPVPIGCHTQPSEPIGDEKGITIMDLTRACCAGPTFRQAPFSICYMLHAGFLLGLFFKLEDRDRMLLRNVG